MTSSQKPMILVVDDEPELAQTIAYALEREGYQSRTVHNGRSALEAATRVPAPDLIVLDLMLPDIAGTEVCRGLRQNELTRLVPVLFLTARDTEIDRVVAFELGADDYVTKPFSLRELTLRIKALLRRRRENEAAPAAASSSSDRLRIDVAAHQVWVDGREVMLTARELKLLGTLVNRRGRVQTRSQLLEDVWGLEAEVTTRSVDTHVKRLREKLGDGGELIETIRGVGYRFRDRC